jgi:hypothetical protein
MARDPQRSIILLIVLILSVSLTVGVAVLAVALASGASSADGVAAMFGAVAAVVTLGITAISYIRGR